MLADTRYAAVVSAPELAHEVGVSESTVTRAAQALGFAGYPDLQARLRQRFVDGVPERVEASLADLGNTPEAAAIRVMLEDAESVRATAEDLDPATLTAIVDLLVATGLAASRGAARRTIAEGGVSVNNARVDSEDWVAQPSDFLHGRWLVLRRGKRNIAGVERVG